VLTTIVALVVLMRPVNRQASWALVPYGAWGVVRDPLTVQQNSLDDLDDSV
jgi:tryptophan-rich sensory protein